MYTEQEVREAVGSAYVIGAFAGAFVLLVIEVIWLWAMAVI